MSPGDLSAETILIVDDEDPVRRTFREWLEGADLGCRILAAADAESALLLANQQTIDLAILDWNLGAGTDGLQLLEDLTQFNPEVVAIMVTGFAQQATIEGSCSGPGASPGFPAPGAPRRPGRMRCECVRQSSARDSSTVASGFSYT